MVSQLGFTVWYPAVGLVLVLFLGISPWYIWLAVIADTLSGALIYHQPFFSWGGLVGAIGSSACYATAAHLLRSSFRIDLSLGRRVDAVRYMLVTLCAALVSSALGVATLAADRTISWRQYWSSAAGWYIGDATGLLSFAPFLLIYVLPVIRSHLLETAPPDSEVEVRAKRRFWRASEVVELGAQFLSIPVILWLVFVSPLASRQYYFVAYLPLVWIAIRQGMRRAVGAIVFYNFGIVVTLRMFPVSTEIEMKIGVLMLVSSAVGLVIGSTVSERFRIGKELAERTRYLNSLIENTPMGIVTHDHLGKVQLCNDEFERLFLFNREELAGRNLDTLIVPQGGAKDSNRLTDMIASGKRIDESLLRQRKDGSLVEVELHASPLVEDGEVYGAVSIYADVSARKLVEIKLREQAAALSNSVKELQGRTLQAGLMNEMSELFQSCETSGEAVSVVADYGARLFPKSTLGALYLFKASRNALNLEASWGTPESTDLMFAPQECWALRKGHPHWATFPGSKVVCDHTKPSQPSLNLCVPMMARGESTGILHLRYAQQEALHAESLDDSWREVQTLRAVSVATHVALSIASLTLRDSLRDQSVRDPLTGLFNRRFMQESLDRELQRATRKSRPVAVVFLDIDHFKRFNDTFGHAAGDSVLVAASDLMKTFFRGDDIVCRHGGEEFAIILPEASEQDAEMRMNEFRERVKQLTVTDHGIPLDRITVSAGIASFPKHALNSESLLRAADRALYHSKCAGRDRVSIVDKLSVPV